MKKANEIAAWTVVLLGVPAMLALLVLIVSVFMDRYEIKRLEDLKREAFWHASIRARRVMARRHDAPWNIVVTKAYANIQSEAYGHQVVSVGVDAWSSESGQPPEEITRIRYLVVDGIAVEQPPPGGCGTVKELPKSPSPIKDAD